MGTLFLSEIKKQACSFLQEKYKSARLILTDVTEAELLAEEATNGEPRSPDAKTMTRISEAAFDIDDYWRITDVLHQRLYTNDWKQWRSTYKALVLLDFLLTHGPETVADEFRPDIIVIQELSKFKHIDERGFNWGAAMQKKSERILKLLKQEELLQEERANALKISKEIQGFGNVCISSTSSSSRISRTSFG
ncbi:Epsin domain-containing protein [Cinnamomum micranthum f. kanehirae]|uniref:Epsin domain-containing protein n=1 Tax=Cinnamomum micranthum f. kanehirae TaxID=337451 RepID=A0A3S3N655_9MAGN|nr:Epsin domain-containing protein [Cinnamomum micranthum f. kanehirae]